MTNNIIPLHHERHLNLKLQESSDFTIFEREHVIPIVIHEFARAALDFPVIFVKNSQTGQFQSVILTGMSEGENLFVNKNEWGANFIPEIVKIHPFKLMKNEHDHSQLMMAIDQGSSLCNEDKGQRLFKDNGDESDYLKTRKEQITNHFEHSQITEAFIEVMTKLDVFEKCDLTITLKNEKMNLNGFYFIDEKRLNNLADDLFLDLKKRGFLQVIYSHLLSIHQIDKLVKLKTKL